MISDKQFIIMGLSHLTGMIRVSSHQCGYTSVKIEGILLNQQPECSELIDCFI